VIIFNKTSLQHLYIVYLYIYNYTGVSQLPAVVAGKRDLKAGGAVVVAVVTPTPATTKQNV